jgi:hypothetical protein
MSLFILDQPTPAGQYRPTRHDPSRTPPLSPASCDAHRRRSPAMGYCRRERPDPPPLKLGHVVSDRTPPHSLLHDAIYLHKRTLLLPRGEPLPHSVSTSNQVRVRPPLPPGNHLSEFYCQRPSTSLVFRATTVAATPAS